MDSKQEWLKSIGAVEYETPVKYTYGFSEYCGCFNLSEEYLEDTPLEELKRQYEASKKYVKTIISGEKQKDAFCPRDLRNVGANQDNLAFPDL